MSNRKKQYYSIKFPFTSVDTENYYFDLNKTLDDSCLSQMFHVIFTPKGSKLRDPEFGTNLLNYIFDPSFTDTWAAVKDEISTAVGLYVKGIKINNINILQSNDEASGIYVRIDYTVVDGNREINKSVVTAV